MVDNDIVLSKVSSIQKCLKRIRSVTRLNPKTLEEIDTQDIFVLNLQRAIQSAIDLAIHVVASEGLGLPDSVRDNFGLLQKEKIIAAGLAKRLQSMVGFRNIAIHDYQTLKLEILKAILTERLKDLEDFYTAILKHFDVPIRTSTKPRPRRKVD